MTLAQSIAEAGWRLASESIVTNCYEIFIIWSAIGYKWQVA